MIVLQNQREPNPWDSVSLNLCLIESTRTLVLYFELNYLAFCSSDFTLSLVVTCNTFKTRTGRVSSDSCSREERRASSRQTGFVRDKISPLGVGVVDRRPSRVGPPSLPGKAANEKMAAEAQYLSSWSATVEPTSWSGVKHKIRICISSDDVVSDAMFSNPLLVSQGEGDGGRIVCNMRDGLNFGVLNQR